MVYCIIYATHVAVEVNYRIRFANGATDYITYTTHVSIVAVGEKRKAARGVQPSGRL